MNPQDPYRFPVYEIPCSPKNTLRDHGRVKREVYNRLGALIGPHLRCHTCGSMWNEHADTTDLPVSIDK